MAKVPEAVGKRFVDTSVKDYIDSGPMSRGPGLLEATYELLDDASTTKTLTEISKEAGVKYEWLQKLKQRAVTNPTVKPLQKLHDYLADSAAH